MAADIHAERLLILDFGAQYTQLIARRIREAGVYCEIWSCDAPGDAIRAFAPRGIVLSGGPETVTAPGSPRADAVVFALGVPVLGICYGMQTMAVQLGGAVEHAHAQEFGHARVATAGGDALLDGLDDGGGGFDAWMSHGDIVTRLPDGFRASASTPSTPIAAMVDARRRFHAVQFHPEVTHTPAGAEMLRRFARDVCGCSGLWTPASIIDDAVARVRAQVGGDNVVLGLSGGVDSAVAAALLARAIGAQLTCIFIDNGLLRAGEADEVMAAFAGSGNALPVRIVRVDAAAEFLGRLRGVADPEAKRRAIGHTFIDVFEREARRAGGARWLGQGTIYPDVIESAASQHGKAHVIKSHHNVGGLPERMQLGLVEPLRELFKDEVRRIGDVLGLPASLLGRHPFPGPGLGVRILGEVTAAAAETLRRADAIFIAELRRAGWYERVAQAFAVFLPVRAVGVVGDARRYEHVVALRAVQTTDFMTADWAPLPHDLLGHVARRIINEVPAVARVVYDISSKPPATIEWE
jgi:GMP synthase (glutamine-hydrolysing)